MKRTSEELIQQALTGIRDTQPESGMEQRLLAALRQRAAVPTPLWGCAVSLPSWNWRLAAVSVAGVLVVVLASLAVHHRAPVAGSIALQPQPPQVVPMDKAIYPVRQPDGSRSLALAVSGSRRAPRRITPVLSGTLAAADRQALDDTNAPSHPAPPMPLTEQERLLLSATRKGDPMEIAELEPVQAPRRRAAAEAREKAGIQQYAKLLLGPLALAESMHPIGTSPKQDEPQPFPAPDPPASSSN